jgi:alpha-D-xyloside xylohydrolase
LNLRYRLLPYIYSEAWLVTENGSTIMRPLVMDFNKDTSALNQSFEYMFGKSFLVAPVTEPEVNELEVYLPNSTMWYDFWTGEKYNGGQKIKTSAPLDRIPLFIKAGSIIPIGSLIQYATEKNDPIEIRIYPGTDSEFTLYEDENDNYNYEKGIYSTIKFSWKDSEKVLTISDRNGSFPGMPVEHNFNIVKVSESKGIGTETVKVYDKALKYKGKKIEVKL